MDDRAPSPTAPPKLAYTWSELSAALGVSLTTLRHLIHTRQLPPPAQLRGSGAAGRPLQLFLAHEVEEHLRRHRPGEAWPQWRPEPAGDDRGAQQPARRGRRHQGRNGQDAPQCCCGLCDDRGPR